MVADFAKLVDVVDGAVRDGVVPGAVIWVGDAGHARFERAFGNSQNEPAPVSARPDTIYDVASLTKAVVTSVLTSRWFVICRSFEARPATTARR